MFDSNLRCLPNWYIAVVHVMAISNKSPLFDLGIRKDDYILCRKPTISSLDNMVDIKIQGKWCAFAFNETPCKDEYLVLDKSLPFAPESITLDGDPLKLYNIK